VSVKNCNISFTTQALNLSIMKFTRNIFFAFVLLAVAQSAFAQPAEVTVEPNGTKILKGFVTQAQLATDTSFKWYAENQKGFIPDATAIQTLRTAKDSIYILAFGGTWCGDTKHILPQVYAMTDAAGLSPDHFTLLGVDRSKKTVNHLSESFGITNVPTFIILKNGKEIGRVVEYGKYGMPDKEIGEIVAGKK
jgi:thiol-disulfide isomerase/thioredoxin